MQRIWAALIGLYVFCATGLAWAGAEAEADPITATEQILDAAKAGRWLLVAAGVLALVMWGLRKARDHTKWFKGDRGGAILVIVLSLVGALITALSTATALDWKLFLGALTVAWTASGGYTNLRRIIWPQDNSAPPTEDSAAAPTE